MNQVKAKFSIVDDGEGLDVDIEGTNDVVLLDVVVLSTVKVVLEVLVLLVVVAGALEGKTVVSTIYAEPYQRLGSLQHTPVLRR